MSPILIALLAVDAVLLIALIVYILVGLFHKDKAHEVKEETIEKTETTEKEQVAESVVKEVKEEVAVTKPSEVVEEVTADEDNEPEDLEDDREPSRRIPFAEKMLGLDEKTKEYYDVINNRFISLRRINPRVSSKGVSYRLGRELVAKLTVRGKTMRLHLALGVKDFPNNVYFQKDLAEVKAYAEVPFTVKVKSDRGLKNALKLIDALVDKKGIESKSRYNRIDSLAELKEKLG